ncbi:MAG: PhnD/SsuA/transferrin family substrate-binding protein [Pirellulaceae bacterium]|nr:PhnD/SsuA/transferrin family substrate-binding protein [Pirellulaceae bacterium]
MSGKFLRNGLCALLGLLACTDRSVLAEVPQPTVADEPLVVVVMDPLSDKLACDCVAGFAQRKYELLGQHLQRRLGRKVEVYWGDSIELALKDENAKRKTPLVADMVIGKHSVVLAEAKAKKLGLEPSAQLTGLDGATTQTGMVVVRTSDPALLVDDLAGYRIIFGPANCDEKNAAPRQLLADAEIELPTELEVASACSVAAQRMIDCPKDEKVAAIISSYAVPLLEGCGTIEKGAMRVIGESDPVPFITVFLREATEERIRQQIMASLTEVAKDSALLRGLESRDGFVPFGAEATATVDPDSKSVAEKKTK